jgi:hypothetical protein
MSMYWSLLGKYLNFRQATVIAACLVATICQGQTTPQLSSNTRMPASYIPDDDVIVKPIDNKISFYQRYVATDTSDEVKLSRNQIKIWSDNQVFASQYGQDSSLIGSAYYVPTQKEKWDYFSNKYLRYLRGRGEQPLRDVPKTWYEEYRASNEVDTIDELEGRFRNTQKKSSYGSDLPDALKAKEINVWKKTNIIFQPRVDQGLVIVGIKNPIADARAWVAANGKTEINVQHSINEIGMRVMFNFYADTGKYFSSVDQKIKDNLYARFTSNKDPKHAVGTPYQDDTLMLLYAIQF